MVRIQKFFFEIFSKIKKNKILSIFIILALGVGCYALIFSFTPKQPVQQTAKVKKEPTAPRAGEVRPLAKGKQTYSIITDKPKNPQILKVTVDPLDVKKGEKQIITVKIAYKNTDSITSDYKTWVDYYTDNTTTTVPLRLKKVDGLPLVAVWQGVWIPKDTHNFRYTASIKAAMGQALSKVDLSFR